MTIKVNAMGDACPIPVVKTQKAMQELGGAGTVETIVDNETAVQNLGKLAASKGCTSKTEKLGENEYRVTITVGENAKVEEQSGECYTCGKPKTVVVLSSDKMVSGLLQQGSGPERGRRRDCGHRHHRRRHVQHTSGGRRIPLRRIRRHRRRKT